MKKLALLFSACLFIQTPAWCVEDTCFYTDCSPADWCCYAKILSGANFLQNTTLTGNKSNYETGYLVAASVGYYGCHGFHVEGEYAYRRNRIKNIHLFSEGKAHHGHFQTSSLMANVLWDLPLWAWGCSLCNTRPFLGAGIGYDWQQMHASNSRVIFSQKWRHFAWQLMAGLTYPLFCQTELTLEYKFHQGGSHFYNHSLGVGLVYSFDFEGCHTYKG